MNRQGNRQANKAAGEQSGSETFSARGGRRRVRSLAVGVAAVASLAGGIGVASTAASAGASASATCSTLWGSLPKSSGDLTGGNLVNIRAGQNTCFDRLVFDVSGPVTGYRVSYVSQVTRDASGEPVPLRGGAFIQIAVLVPSFDLNGNPTYNPANPSELVNVSGFQTFRQVADAGSFEGQTTVGLGVRARLPYRVLTLAPVGGISRVVVDVAHRW